MDTGGYRRGTSITSSFAGAHGDMSRSYTSTPPAGFQSPATSIPVDYTPVSQKLDQLLFLYLEEKKEISELKGAVSSLTEKVKEVMECREEASAKKEQTADGKRSYKIPTDLSVSSYIYTLKTAAPTVMDLFYSYIAVKQLHENSPSNIKFDGKEV
jgi:hypothetical protein